MSAGAAEGDVLRDDKDWTWVLDRACPECGLDAQRVPGPEVAGRLRADLPRWRQVLAGPGARERPAPGTWSPLEYGCHVRDVFRLFDARLVLMLTEDDPLFPDWDQDATAVQERYGEQDPEQVAAELDEAARRLTARLDGVRGEQWHRPGRRTDGAVFDVTTFARYLLHDPVHHLRDVTRDITCDVTART